MRTISQRQLRNDNAEVIRAVEAGESFVVTKRGHPVAVVGPVPGRSTGLPLGRPARRRVDYADWPRITSAVASGEILDDLRAER